MKIIYEFDSHNYKNYPSLKCYEIEAESIDELLSNGYYPDPFKEKFNGNVYYALKGCYFDYIEYCKSEAKAIVSGQILDHFGFDNHNVPINEWENKKKEFENNIKPWYIK